MQSSNFDYFTFEKNVTQEGDAILTQAEQTKRTSLYEAKAALEQDSPVARKAQYQLLAFDVAILDERIKRTYYCFNRFTADIACEKLKANFSEKQQELKRAEQKAKYDSILDKQTASTNVRRRSRSNSMSGIVSRVLPPTASTVEALTLCGMIAKVPLHLSPRTQKNIVPPHISPQGSASYNLRMSVDLTGNPIFTLEEKSRKRSLDKELGEAVKKKLQAEKHLEEQRKCAKKEEEKKTRECPNNFSPLALATAALKQAIIKEAKARYQLLAFEVEVLDERHHRTYITGPVTRFADENLCLLLKRNLESKKTQLQQVSEEIRCLRKPLFGQCPQGFFSQSSGLAEALKQRQRPLSERRVEKMMERHDRLFAL